MGHANSFEFNSLRESVEGLVEGLSPSELVELRAEGWLGPEKNGFVLDEMSRATANWTKSIEQYRTTEEALETL